MCIECDTHASTRLDVPKFLWDVALIIPILTAQIKEFVERARHVVFAKRAHKRAHERAHKRAHERENRDMMSRSIPKL